MKYLETMLALTLMVLMGSCAAAPEPESIAEYEPTWESIKTHQVPAWYDGAKLGIFIHWGLYSVPAFAPPTGALHEVDWNVWFKNNAYAEWYLNTLRISDSKTAQHHAQTYGADFDYYNFASEFNEEVQKWDPLAMAKLFREVGARYVVLTTKHHDGFTLWPSEVVSPHLPEGQQQASRDLVGELTQAVRGEGMRMGLYYSGGLDWSFNKTPVETVEQVLGTIIHTEEYAKYADAHWRELIDKYQPAILWNDIGYPRQGDRLNIFADYYNRFPSGLINNRFGEEHYDFTTPEYQKMDKIQKTKWETCRGLGFSFGYNQVEGPEHTIEPDALVELLVDITSKNGNLLLNVGPKADGSIPEIQVERLRALGGWLDVNGEAIFGSRPWVASSSQTSSEGEVRFTTNGGSLYAVLFDDPGKTVSIRGLKPADGTTIELLGAEGALNWSQEGDDVSISLPGELPGEYAYTLKITPVPQTTLPPDEAEAEAAPVSSS